MEVPQPRQIVGGQGDGVVLAEQPHHVGLALGLLDEVGEDDQLRVAQAGQVGQHGSQAWLVRSDDLLAKAIFDREEPERENHDWKHL